MSDVIDEALSALSEKLAGGFDGVVKFVLTGEGAIMLDGSGVRAADEEADVTLTAEPGVFQDMLEGDLSAAAAFMSGKLAVDGDMGVAMKLAGILG